MFGAVNEGKNSWMGQADVLKLLRNVNRLGTMRCPPGWTITHLAFEQLYATILDDNIPLYFQKEKDSKLTRQSSPHPRTSYVRIGSVTRTKVATMKTPLSLFFTTLLFFVFPAFAQFQFFEQMFNQGGQQNQQPQNAASDSAWYKQQYEAGESPSFMIWLADMLMAYK